jgi:hypothetical protein
MDIIGSSHKENHDRSRSYSDDRYLQVQLDHIELPRETIYMIDKVVRQRAKRGPFGVENSELINDVHDKDALDKNERIQRLVEGMSSNSRIMNPNDESHIKEGDISGEGVVRRINSV